MPLTRVGPDSNGLYYNAVSTAEWQGAYGDQLRAAGYRYCGYGTWGVYVAAAGDPCSSRDAGPSIVPVVIPPGGQPGGVTPQGQTPAPVTSCCRQVVTRLPPPSSLPMTPAPEETPAAVDVGLSNVPRWFWWLILILVILVLVRR